MRSREYRRCSLLAMAAKVATTRRKTERPVQQWELERQSHGRIVGEGGLLDPGSRCAALGQMRPRGEIRPIRIQSCWGATGQTVGLKAFDQLQSIIRLARWK